MAARPDRLLRRFAGIELNRDPVPDATTVLHFRHWLDRHGLTEAIFDEVGAMLEERGQLMRQGMIVDATIIAAPPSTKNKQKRNPSSAMPAMPGRTSGPNSWTARCPLYRLRFLGHRIEAYAA